MVIGLFPNYVLGFGVNVHVKNTQTKKNVAWLYRPSLGLELGLWQCIVF